MGRLVIKKLGAVENYELDIKHINVLIGEQATGKSTICKAMYFFRMMKNEITEYLFRISTRGNLFADDFFPKALNATAKDIFIQLFGYSWNLPEDLFAEYFYTDEISISMGIGTFHGKKYFQIEYSNNLLNKIRKLEKKVRDSYKNQNSELTFSYFSTESARLHHDLQQSINSIFDDDLETYYIPAGRSLLTLMTNQKTKLDYSALDLVNRKFMQFIENIQPKFDRGISKVHMYYPRPERKFTTENLTKELLQGLKGDYYFNDGQEYLAIDDGAYHIPINFISSGQQEVLWLLNQLYILMLRDEKSFVVIEEPEAHLYPKLQKQVIDFIVKFANLTGSIVIVTTHSPYVLTCINTLCYAGKIAENKKRKVEEIVGKYTCVQPGDIYAGKLIYQDGMTKVENLVMQPEQELYTELIDDVSDINNEIYTRLCELEE